MRNTFRHTLGIFLLSTFSSLPVAAQVLPTGPPPLRTAIQEMPSGIKLGDVPVGVELGNSELLANYPSTIANGQRTLKRFEDIQQLKIVIETLLGTPSSENVHILIWRAMPDLDRKMIREVPMDLSTNMPVFQAMAPSSQDLRGMFVLPQLPAATGQPRKVPIN